MARLRPSTHRAGLASVLLVLLVCSSTVTAAAATPDGHRSRKLLVTEPRVSPETTSLTEAHAQQQEMDVGGWRDATPFRRPEASLGRRIPGSHANPSHN